MIVRPNECLQQPPRTHGGLNALTDRPLECEVVLEGSLVPRPAPGSKDPKQHPVLCGAERLAVSLERGPRRATVQEGLDHLRLHHPGLQRERCCEVGV